jgi:hypothetical protein
MVPDPIWSVKTETASWVRGGIAAGTWIIQVERMKAEAEHQVPLGIQNCRRG